MEFLKSTELGLNPAGYLISKTTKKPVNHEQFVNEQKAAEYLVKLSEAIKDKNFTCGKIDNLAAIKAEVEASINNNSHKEYVKTGSKPTNQVYESLIDLALQFDKFEDEKSSNDAINKVMNQFNKINDVEEVGEYFHEGIVKLSKIYTIDEILIAVKINISKFQ